ncbi:MAG TPA: YjgN family protein [Aquabacterium sp.]|uniref:YjgN family protein n=1 Tax=Aquabacterium sp. TaxID=1872578 RepID=UPI002E37FDBB|nr:YjgN family protein [Aquabacterium sp.]HEX5354921.1 YjgN family protein [Aquabacterium sp.]
MHQTSPSAPQAGGMTASPLITHNAGEPPLPLVPHPVSLHTIRFTGSGSEYFRIWIVNLLLMLVTLGLYYPWAKVRKLQYFYGNTVVIGHPLAFHGNPKQMLRGFLLVSLLMVLYAVAGKVSPEAGSVAALILAAIWPALMRASLQFRLAQTSWRGLRFHFTGSLKDAYMVFLKPILVSIGVGLLSVILAVMLPRALTGVILGLVMVVGLACLGPYMLWRLKQYQHQHYALGQLQTSFKARFGDVLRIFLKTGLLTVAALIGIGVIVAVLAATMGVSLAGQRPDARTLMSWGNVIVGVVAVSYLLITQVIQGPYFSSRLQNLIWTQTGNRLVRFKSHLGWGHMARLSLQNWLLIVLTLGLYWPFAAVALARARLQAIVIHTRQDPDLLLAQASRNTSDATGDLAADLMGIDVGL